ncbi:MAG: hypothetical protein AAF680_11135 [Pseudomonadota bacterium]
MTAISKQKYFSPRRSMRAALSMAFASLLFVLGSFACSAAADVTCPMVIEALQGQDHGDPKISK